MICAGGAVDRVDPAEHAAADRKAAGEPEQQGQRQTPADRLLDQRLELQAVLDLAPDQQPEVAARLKLAARARRRSNVSPVGTGTVKSIQPSASGPTSGQRARLPAIRRPIGSVSR